MAAVTICSDFGAQKDKVSHCFPTYFPWSDGTGCHSVLSNSLRPHGLHHARLPVHHQLLEFTQTHVHWVSDAIQPSHPLSSPSPAFNLSQHRVFSNESVLCIRGPKYWVSASTSVLPINSQDWSPCSPKDSQESSPKHHSSKAAILLCSAFFIVQLSHPYMNTVKTIALATWTFVGKVMSLLFNMLS